MLSLTWAQAIYRLTVASVAIGVVSLFAGMLMPRRVKYDSFPYKPYKFEQNGKFYWALNLQKWKRVMPDASRVVKLMARKALKDDTSAAYMRRLAAETCVAEATHWLLIILSPVFYIIVPDARGAAYAVLYSLCNLPFIAIQRYNRPRLLRAMRMREKREAAKGNR